MTSEMKDSGVDWIGDVPCGWEIAPIKYIFEIIGSGTTPDSSNQELYDGDINWIQSGDLYQINRVLSSKKTITKLGQQSSTALKIYKQPFIAVAMYGASIGNLAISEIDATVNQAVAVLKDDDVKVKYGKYALESSKNELINAALGGTQPNISQALIQSWKIPQPTIQEQEIITNFLDDKTTKIGKAHDLLTCQIETLKNYRKSLIYEAVTKGFDTKVKLRPSGVDWIGDVPYGWEIKRLKDVVKFQTGGTPKESIGVNQELDGIKWFKTSDFDDKSIELNKAENYIRQDIVKRAKINIYPQNTVMLVGIASIGKVGISRTESYSNQQITALINNQSIESLYLGYIVSAMSKYIKDTALYTVVPIVNNQYLSSLAIPFPNLEEQKNISDFLDGKTKIIDTIIQNKQQQIQNLDKQRKTLIYDYVTGKKRVR